MKSQIATLILLLTLLQRITTSPLTLFEAVTRFYRQGNRYDELHNSDTPGYDILRQKEYDFIVIGAGSSGSIVASRLSEDPVWKVLLLEAGRDEIPFLDVPVIVGYFQLTNYNWGYKTQPQNGACRAMKNNQCNWPRGKSLGGTSSINYMLYTRGHRGDYDRWADAGNTGWSYDEVLPYFKKSENIEIPELMDSKFHSRGGPLNVGYTPFYTPLVTAFLKAGEELGNSIIDYNGESMMGFSRFQVNQRNGTRCSASKAFLRPIRHRTNLHISMNTRVTKILIDPLTKRATGVEFTKNRLSYSITAKKEVILSAGALNSPQLLMLSGVGPKEHLQELDIPVIQDLKVGHNLQEQVGFLGALFLVNETVGMVEQRIINGIPEYGLEYTTKGTGPFTTTGGAEGVGFMRTEYAPDERPDVELLFVAAGLNADAGGATKEHLGLSDEFYEDMYRSIDHLDAWSIWPLLMHPKSRGIVKLRDKNPWHWPLFYANFFADPHDLKTLIEGVKYSIKLSETRAFQKFGSKLYRKHIPGCIEFEFGTDDYWGCAVRHLTSTIHHQCGTCKMGPATDEDAVVGPDLKVYGIEGLRVVDASVIPFVPTAHTNAPSYMIGEKASDLIKTHWDQKFLKTNLV